MNNNHLEIVWDESHNLGGYFNFYLNGKCTELTPEKAIDTMSSDEAEAYAKEYVGWVTRASVYSVSHSYTDTD